jgi:predicted porin
MKKLTLVAAIAAIAASGAATAGTVYEKDGVTWKVSADVQIQFLQKVGDDEVLDVNYDDAELKNKFNYKLANGWDAFAETHFEFRGVSTQETFVGIDFGSAKVLVGNTATATDGFGVENEIDVMGVAGDAFPVDSSDDLIKATFDAGAADIAVSYDIEGVTKTPDAGETAQKSAADLLVTVPVGHGKFEFAYQAATLIDDADADVDVNTLGVSLQGKLGGAWLGLAYSTADKDGQTDNRDVIHLSAKFSGFAVGYESVDQGATDLKSWYANYTHTLAKNVTTFVEIGDTNAADSDVGYLAGMRVKF